MLGPHRQEAPAIQRRDFLKGALGAAGSLVAGAGGVACGSGPAAPPGDGWNAGDLLHLLPTVNHRRFRVKASFRTPRAEALLLDVNGRRTRGRSSDSGGQHFTFDLSGLDPATDYTLRILEATGDPICDSWPLATFPAPDDEPEHFRLLAYMCAGGPDRLFGYGLVDAYLRIAQRQRLFARALSFSPDAAIANGDHVYWDLKSRFGWAMGESIPAGWVAGHFDRNQPVLGTQNEGVLQRAFGPQIADLYGVRFRSLPVFFLQDDHDYGENDEASEELRTFPPDPFMLDLARSTQRLYYPELLVDEAFPLPYALRGGMAESFGGVRYGRLFEALLYDCRRFLANGADPAAPRDDSWFVPPDIERWLLARTASSPCAHLAHMPSTPVLWSAGKWGEWYPDTKDENGVLRADLAKPYWPGGWGDQHDRLIRATAARRDRTPLWVSGDLHAVAAGRMLSSHGQSLEKNPPVSVLCGAIGTGAFGWPSKFRNQRPLPSGTLTAEEWIEPLERNGFTLLDFTPQSLTLSFFAWSPDDGDAAIDTLEPFRVLELPRPSRS